MNARSMTLTNAFAALCGAALAAMALSAGCSSNDKMSGVGDAKLPAGVRSENIEHESCDESGHRVETLDANNDGKADIRRVYDNKTGKEICRITDLNHDGRPDMFEYFDANGTIRRREADYDESGVVDSIEYFENGRLVRRELDTTGQNRIDTWDFFDPATGKRTRRERDASNDGKIDQWWTFNGDQVTIDIDKNEDGKPDPDQTVNIGGPPPDAGLPAPPQMPDMLDAGMGSPLPGDASLPPATPTGGLDLDAGAVKALTQDAAAPKGGSKK